MKIALIGYGKMGKEIEKIALSRGHEIVSIIDVNNQEDFESAAFKSADVAIEFTNPTAAYNNYMKAFKADVKLVSGSTGWLEEHGEEVRKLCSEGGKTLFWSSNFSLGRQQISGEDHEPVPCLRRNNERNSPYTQAGCSKRHCHYPGRRYSG